MKSPTFPLLALLAALAIATTGCEKKSGRDAAAAREKASASSSHAHAAPHGGTLIEIGEHQFNLELLFDEARGVLQAWFLDGHAENFVRVAMPSFEVAAQAAGGEVRTLTFRPVASSMSGETAGDTSQFEAAAPWLRDAKAFDGTIKTLTVRGVSFSDLTFEFPAHHDAPDHAKEPAR